VHNAIKFTRDGGKVWVSCWTTTDGFYFDVKDTGVGISPDKLKISGQASPKLPIRCAAASRGWD